jgi:hypothetical protein
VDPVVELLDRQGDFLAQVEPFLRVLRSEPRLAFHLEDLEAELVDESRGNSSNSAKSWWSWYPSSEALKDDPSGLSTT